MPAVTEYVERILTVLNPDASVKGVAIDVATAVDGEVVRSNQVPATDLTDPAVAGVLDALSASVGQEILALRAAVTAAVSAEDHAIVVSARDAALAEVARLTALLPPEPGPREVTPREFLERISDADKVAIMQSRDPRCMKAIWTLFTAPSIDLDSPLLVDLIDALVAAGIEIDAADRARIFA